MHIALLGTGNMGRAIIQGLLDADPSVSLTVYDILPQACGRLPERVLVKPPQEWFSGKESPDAVILAVKPADIGTAAASLYAVFKKSPSAPLIISIAAGVNIASLRECTGNEVRICRVMPNTPAKVGHAMSAYACSETCSDGDRLLVNKVFSACGRAVEVPEKLLHAVTGLSGSGPAYVFLFIEALIEGGVTAGLPYAVARECAVQTVLGAAMMVQQSDEHTGAFKAAVMSPGGTTAAGLRALEEGAFKHAVINAVTSATERSIQLGS